MNAVLTYSEKMNLLLTVAEWIGYLPHWVYGRSLALNWLFAKMVRMTIEEEERDDSR